MQVTATELPLPTPVRMAGAAVVPLDDWEPSVKVQGAPASAGWAAAAPAALETATLAKCRSANEASHRQQRNCGSLDPSCPPKTRHKLRVLQHFAALDSYVDLSPAQGPPQRRTGILDARLALSRRARSHSSRTRGWSM